MGDKGTVVKTFPRPEEWEIKGQWLKHVQASRMWTKETVVKYFWAGRMLNKRQ